MNNNEEIDSKSIVEKNTEREALTPNEYTPNNEVNTELREGSPPKNYFHFLENFNADNLKSILSTLIIGILGMLIIIFLFILMAIKLIMSSKILSGGLILVLVIVFLRNLPVNKIKALNEVIQSVVTSIFK